MRRERINYKEIPTEILIGTGTKELSIVSYYSINNCQVVELVPKDKVHSRIDEIRNMRDKLWAVHQGEIIYPFKRT